MSAAPLTRRMLLSATAAVGACALPVIAEAGIPASDPDAELFALLDRFDKARAAWDATKARLDEAGKRARAAYPPRPDALQFRASDLGHKLGSSGSEPLPNGHFRGFYTEQDVGRLRAAPPLTQWALADDSVQPPAREPDPEGEARRLEIVSAFDAWQADRRAVDDFTGHTAASATEDAAGDLLEGLAQEVKRARPRTLVGLRALAGWFGRQAEAGAAHDDALALLAATVATFGGVAT